MSARTTFLSPVLCRLRGWSSNELAKINQAVRELDDTGTRLETAWGMSDEGDPWFAVSDAASGNLILHLVRLDGTVTAITPDFDAPLRAGDLDTAIIESIGRLQRRWQNRSA